MRLSVIAGALLLAAGSAKASESSIIGTTCFDQKPAYRLTAVNFSCHLEPFEKVRSAEDCAKKCGNSEKKCVAFNFEVYSNHCQLLVGSKCPVPNGSDRTEFLSDDTCSAFVRKTDEACAPSAAQIRPRAEARELPGKAPGRVPAPEKRTGGAAKPYAPPRDIPNVDLPPVKPGAGGAAGGAGGAKKAPRPEDQAVKPKIGALSDKQVKRIQEAAAMDPDPESSKLLMQMAENLVESTGSVTFKDIVGLQDVKAALTTAAVFPILNPQLFTGARARNKGVLLFGPPGNGKTYVAKALANQVNIALEKAQEAWEANEALPPAEQDQELKRQKPKATEVTFLSITASAIGSKWLGESEKLMASMFKLARLLAPAIIFIDEVDSLLGQRKEGNGRDTNNKVVNQFLTSLDGVGSGDEQIVVLAATNRPFDLDTAALRRMPGKFYVPLPDKAARIDIMSKLLAKHPAPKDITPEVLDRLADETEDYSAADLTNVMKLAAKVPLRELSKDKSTEELMAMELEHLRPLSYEDIKTGLGTVRASASKEVIKQLEAWNRSHGNASKVGTNPDAVLDAKHLMGTMRRAARAWEEVDGTDSIDTTTPLLKLLARDPVYAPLLVRE